MMHLLPEPQSLVLEAGYLNKKTFRVTNCCQDPRIEIAVQKLPLSNQGTELLLTQEQKDTEGYTLRIESNRVTIHGDSAAGAFYGIQTLRQILEGDSIPCLQIQDTPDFSYRGFYHDVTRGKIPLLSTMLELIDRMAYVKMNSLQLYIEHSFPFRELGDHAEKNGYLTAEEIRKIDEYCWENFIELIPSVATFGHLYELLELEPYRDLRELPDFQEDQLYWYQRMGHHTINPTDPRSIDVVTSLIDQILPLCRTNKFNICCDETFDLKNGIHKDMDTGSLYTSFVKKIITHVQSQGKQVMMWADILLQHPETIDDLPEDVIFLNWTYSPEPDAAQFMTLKKLNRQQIVCPGINTWSKLVEGIHTGTKNVLRVCELGFENKALGVLNTNWGDYGNPCSLDLSMHGMVLGAAKAWNRKTDKNARFDNAINALIYKNGDCVRHLTALDAVNREIAWSVLAFCYSNCIYEKQFEIRWPTLETVRNAQEVCSQVREQLQDIVWERDEYRQELLVAAEGLIVMAELLGLLACYPITRRSDTLTWLSHFRDKWLQKNKPSELFRIEEMFETLDRYIYGQAPT